MKTQRLLHYEQKKKPESAEVNRVHSRTKLKFRKKIYKKWKKKIVNENKLNVYIVSHIEPDGDTK